MVSPLLSSFFVMMLGQPAAEALPVDVHDFLVVGHALRARHALGERRRQDALPEVLGFEEVRVARVGPEQRHDQRPLTRAMRNE